MMEYYMTRDKYCEIWIHAFSEPLTRIRFYYNVGTDQKPKWKNHECSLLKDLSLEEQKLIVKFLESDTLSL
jgi:hypothetical protein